MSTNLTPVSIRLTDEQIEFCKSKGDRSKYVRSLIEKNMKLNQMIHELLVKCKGNNEAM